MCLPYLTTEALENFIKHSLAEDIGPGDYSSLASIDALSVRTAQLICKSAGVVAGVELAVKIFASYDESLRVDTLMKDGDLYKGGGIVLKVTGPARSILSCERLVLNCVQRMSGIATHTHTLTQMVKHTSVKLLDTRKTTPGFRLCEKWAVAIGGGQNHRYGLYDMIMLKDNHIDYCGGVVKAVTKTQKFLAENHLSLEIVVEVRNETELRELLTCSGIRRVLLDNMKPDQLIECVRIVNRAFETEASGGINQDNLVAYAETGVDYISMGSLIYGAGVLDFSLKAVA